MGLYPGVRTAGGLKWDFTVSPFIECLRFYDFLFMEQSFQMTFTANTQIKRLLSSPLRALFLKFSKHNIQREVIMFAPI